MIRTLRHRLTFVLFVLLPFHALLVTVGTKFLAGPGSAPLPLLAVWKELLIVAIFMTGIGELALAERKTIMSIVKGNVTWSWSLNIQQSAVLLMLLVAVLLVPMHNDPVSFIYGFKYLFAPLIFFLVVQKLEWEKSFLARVQQVLLRVGVCIAVYGLVTLVASQSFFSVLGYSDAHSLYSPGTPLAAFQQIGGTGVRRMQSTFAGPNQLGMWLLVPWSAGVVMMLKKKRVFVNAVLIGLAIVLTFSRAAWIAAVVIVLAALCTQWKGKRRTHALWTLCIAVGVLVSVLWLTTPELLERGMSNRHHLERTTSGIAAMVARPLGHGLGTAGPASNRLADPCVYFEDGADVSWASAREDLCVFVGATQVRPEGQTCSCPVLPENWYVQVGYELGVLGFVLFIVLIVSLIRVLRNKLHVCLPLLGVAIAALFLHAFEDSAVAYTIWGMAGMALSTQKNP